MKIIYHPASPYSRKVRIMAYEVGLWDSIDFENPGHLSPTEPHSRVIEFNPLGKIPTLVLDDGQCIVDSRVICEYLDSLHENPKMFPQNEDERYHVLALQALADGVLDAAVITRYELAFRPENLQWPDWITAQKLRIFRLLDHFNDQCNDFKDKLDIGTITIACCLGYLDFRYHEDNWRAGRVGLANWFDIFSSRESMKRTVPST